MAGMVAQGLQIVGTVWDDTRKPSLRWFDAELERLKGELLLLHGKGDANPRASECFHRALEISQQQGARVYELRAATSLARICRGRGDEATARAEVERAYGRFSEGFETSDLRRAAEYLTNSPRPGPLTAPPSPDRRRVDPGV